jgi:platelet-activating factor acetylhydrolase IB subunit alpha
MDLRGHEHVVECASLAPPKAHESLCKLAGTKPSKSSVFAATGSRDKTIKLWNVETGVCIATLNGHDNWVRALVFHPDGKYLLSSSDDKSIKIWDLDQGPRCSRTIEDAHGHFVSCMRWGLSTAQIVEQRRRKGEETNGHQQQEDLGKGRYVLASAGVDQTIKIWLP